MHWRRPLVVDTALALAVAALTWGTMELERECQCPVRALAVVLVLAQSIPLAFRRLAPVPVWLVLGVVTGVHGGSTVQDPPVFFGALLAVYTVVSLSSRRTSIVVGIVTAVSIAVAVAASDDTRLQGRDTAPAPTFTAHFLRLSCHADGLRVPTCFSSQHDDDVRPGSSAESGSETHPT